MLGLWKESSVGRLTETLEEMVLSSKICLCIYWVVRRMEFEMESGAFPGGLGARVSAFLCSQQMAEKH